MMDQLDKTEDLVRIEGLTKIFGRHHRKAAELFKAGKTREEVYKATQCSVGVHDINFTIRRGELFVVMGLSGSGKSTLIRTINRLIEPSDGKIFIDGTEVTALNKKQLRELRRRRIGMVFQQFALYPHLTVLDNAAYALKIAGVPRETRRARAREVLALVGLADYADRYPDQLSGGMRQRVGIARALAVKPEVLLMDEPTSALDPGSTMKVEELMSELKKNYTVVIVTHNMQQAARISDRTAFFLLGELVEVGPTNQIFSAPQDKRTEDYISGRFG